MPEDNLFNKEVPEGANPSVAKDTKAPEAPQKTDDKETNPDDSPVDAKTPLNKVPRFQEVVKEKNDANDRVTDLEQQLEDSRSGKTEPAPAETTDSDATPWFESGSTQRPPNWPGVYKQIKEDAKKEMYTELSDAVRTERAKTQTEDVALDNDIKEIRDTGDFTDEDEKGLLALHTEMYGNATYQPGAIKKTLSFYKKMNTAKAEGSQEGQELEQRKQVAGKAGQGAGEGTTPKGVAGGYKKLRTSSLQSLAAEAAATLLGNKPKIGG